MFKKGIAFLSALMVCSCFMLSDICYVNADDSEYSGTYGENVFWKYADGTLTIYGSGAMRDTSMYEINSKGHVAAKTPWIEFCSDIQTVIVEGDVTTIGYSAFGGCENLTELIVTAPIAEIKSLCFKGCTNLTTAILPDSAISINPYAFRDCTQMLTQTDEGMLIFDNKYVLDLYRDTDVFPIEAEEMTVPDGITTLCQQVFDPKLKQIHIPDSVRSVCIDTFKWCTTLLEQSRRDDGFTLIDGKLLVECTNTDLTLFIPDGTTVIANDLMNQGNMVGNTNLHVAVCPESLRTIGAYAFYKNKNLMRVELNDGLEIIGTNAFGACSHLTSLTIPESVTEIGSQENCPLTDIYGVAGSEAERFANRYGIAFHDISSPDTPPEQNGTAFDYAKDGWSFGNSREAFNGEYYLTAEDLAAVQAFTSSSRFYEAEWNGSCFGLSLTVVLAANGLILPAQLQRGAQRLSEVAPSQAVQSLIHYYHAVQYSSVYLQDAAASAKETPAQRLGRMVTAAKNIQSGGSPFLLEFSYSSGSHAVVGYGHESGTWVYHGQTYDNRILIWDPNSPAALHDDACLYYNSVTFGYCIPFYGLRYSSTDPADNSGGITHFCNDLSVLNAYPYPFERGYDRGDLDFDGAVSVADAVLLFKHLTTQSALTAGQLRLADLSGDAKISAVDLTLLKALVLAE